MTLSELRTKLNYLRVDPVWREWWALRGADLSEVVACVRHMLDLAKARQQAGDETGSQAWIDHIDAYVSFRFEGEFGIGLPPRPEGIEAGTAPRVGSDPMEQDGDGPTLWKATYDRYPDRSFKEAIYLFKHHYGYWPSTKWPYMPRSRLDKMAKIKNVPLSRLILNPQE